jgi:transcription initiation protein SPT3
MVRSLTLAGLSVKKSLEDSLLLSTSPRLTNTSLKRKRADGDTGDAERDAGGDEDGGVIGCSLFLSPPEARGALRPEHIQDAFARMQGDWAHHRSAGMRNWRGGLIRTRVSLI